MSAPDELRERIVAGVDRVVLDAASDHRVATSHDLADAVLAEFAPSQPAVRPLTDDEVARIAVFAVDMRPTLDNDTVTMIRDIVKRADELRGAQPAADLLTPEDYSEIRGALGYTVCNALIHPKRRERLLAIIARLAPAPNTETETNG